MRRLILTDNPFVSRGTQESVQTGRAADRPPAGVAGPTSSGITAELRRTIRAAANRDGGWPYYAGSASRLEPTCWTRIALGASGDPDAPSPTTLLSGVQREDGLLLDTTTAGPNYTWNGLALLSELATSTFPAPWRGGLVAALLRAKGVPLTGSAASAVRQNGQLQAWSWVDGTFSWIEPTAVCLLAVKKAKVGSDAAAARIADAEAVILDRVCDGGGWNYGNAQVLSQDLRPYVPTTSLALLAMQDQREHPAVQASVAWLESHATTEPGAMALSLAIVCLTVFGRPTGPAREALLRQHAHTQFLGNVHLCAMALYALTVPAHGARAFTL